MENRTVVENLNASFEMLLRKNKELSEFQCNHCSYGPFGHCSYNGDACYGMHGSEEAEVEELALEADLNRSIEEVEKEMLAMGFDKVVTNHIVYLLGNEGFC